MHFLLRKRYFQKFSKMFSTKNRTRKSILTYPAVQRRFLRVVPRGFAARHGIIHFSTDRWHPRFLNSMQIVTSEVYSYHNFLRFSSNFFEFLVNSSETLKFLCILCAFRQIIVDSLFHYSFFPKEKAFHFYSL